MIQYCFVLVYYLSTLAPLPKHVISHFPWRCCLLLKRFNLTSILSLVHVVPFYIFHSVSIYPPPKHVVEKKAQQVGMDDLETMVEKQTCARSLTCASQTNRETVPSSTVVCFPSSTFIDVYSCDIININRKRLTPHVKPHTQSVPRKCFARARDPLLTARETRDGECL